MTNKRKQRVREIQEKTGMSYQAASNALAQESPKEPLFSQKDHLRHLAFHVEDGEVVCDPAIRIIDFDVATLLLPYWLEARDRIERKDLLVGRVSIQVDGVRAYYRAEMGYTGHEFEHVLIPEAIYERAVHLSRGPFTPFPAEYAPADVKEFVGWLRKMAFPTDGEPKTITLNAQTYARLRRAIVQSGTFDPCTQAVLLKQGFFGSLYERDQYMGRTTPVYCSREVSSVEFDRPHPVDSTLTSPPREADILDLIKDEYKDRLPEPMTRHEALDQLTTQLLATEEGKVKLADATISLLREGKGMTLDPRSASRMAAILEALRGPKVA